MLIYLILIYLLTYSIVVYITITIKPETANHRLNESCLLAKGSKHIQTLYWSASSKIIAAQDIHKIEKKNSASLHGFLLEYSRIPVSTLKYAKISYIFPLIFVVLFRSFSLGQGALLPVAEALLLTAPVIWNHPSQIIGSQTLSRRLCRKIAAKPRSDLGLEPVVSGWMQNCRSLLTSSI